ncbi:MAG: GntR family transcriptional regulator [Firmicutes bacterium]|nr:GntR family transcriptional regulator [Bacillota bacterium]
MAVILRSLSEQVYDHILRQIKLGELLRGDTIMETKLAEQFGTSRTTAREALLMLTNEGILENGKKRGFIVKGNTQAELEKKWALIAQLDAFAAELAIPFMNDAHIAEMESLIKRMDLAIDQQDHEFYTDTQEAFHDVYYRICGNEFVVEAIVNVQKSLVRLTSLSENKELQFEQYRGYNDEHRQILELFKQKDPVKLRELLLDHYTYTAGDFLF